MKTVFGMLVLVAVMCGCSGSDFDSDYDGGEDGGTDGSTDVDSDADSDSDSDSDSGGGEDGGEDSDSETDTESDYEAIVEGCDPSAAAWPLQWSIKETELLGYINEAREGGADCGSMDGGTFGPTAPLTMNPYIQCAARVHSLSSHSSEDPLGITPEERLENAGYDGSFLGENLISGGDGDPYFVIDIWLGSSPLYHWCSILMNPEVTEVGIGFASVDGSLNQFYWTGDFGTP